MAKLDLDITVIGAGIGGLTAALALAQRGARVQVLEQAEEIREVGAGLQISPNGYVVLAALGLAEPFDACSIAAEAVQLRDYRKGAPVFRLPLHKGAHHGRFRFVHRADLQRLLLDAALEAGISVQVGAQVTQLVQGNPANLTTASGQHMDSELIVAADGLKSIARAALNEVTSSEFSRQVAWRLTVPNLIGHPPEAQVHMGPGRHLVSYPIRDGHTLNVVAVIEQAAWAEEGWSQMADGDLLRSAFAGFHSDVHHMLAGPRQISRWGLFRHPVARNWHGAGVALLGDAAHPTLPFMAQGANMALEDAWVLADCLSAQTDQSKALAAYQGARETRVRRIVDTATGNAWKYHLSGGLTRFAAHSALRLASATFPQVLERQFDWIYSHDVTA